MVEIILSLIQSGVEAGAAWALANPEMAAVLVLGVIIGRIV